MTRYDFWIFFACLTIDDSIRIASVLRIHERADMEYENIAGHRRPEDMYILDRNRYVTAAYAYVLAGNDLFFFAYCLYELFRGVV